ncbi:flagellar biosynthesis protein FlhA [Enterobacter cancerogenus]|uniref:Flagellar biosynthesis protein FlhA n=1 Tax=Enterobacter cancerogenus TaxID=69218 RepID=A0A484XW91_9ENTR|nr:flagellar biosynthesis protein FlhA [Enterobacter cancerogenus]
MANSKLQQALAILSKGRIGVPVLLLCVLAMVMLPLSPLMLDILFTFNIVLAVVVLLVAVNMQRPLDFAVFPDAAADHHADATYPERRLYPRGVAAWS